MATTHNLGFPRIGELRELKFALESYWRGDSSETELQGAGASLREGGWQAQGELDYAAAGDFSFYDQVLDMSVTLGNLPQRVNALTGTDLDRYFLAARGRSAEGVTCTSTYAGEMTKWFDTNYHYIVPEFIETTSFTLNFDRLRVQLREAQQQGRKVKPVIIGPLTYLWLGKSKDHSNRLDLLETLLLVYQQLLQKIAELDIEWVQIDEPILATELEPEWRNAFAKAYHRLKCNNLKILLATYFGELKENLRVACDLPVDGIHLDAISARSEVNKLIDWLPAHKVVSLGVINGRNIWAMNLEATLNWLEPIYKKLGSRLWLAPSCSLQHVPVNLKNEDKLDAHIHSWLSFAVQKLEELRLVSRGLSEGREVVAVELALNKNVIQGRAASTRVHKPDVKNAVQALALSEQSRLSGYSEREALQAGRFNLPDYPTTTIGSFPQTKKIRQARLRFKKNEITPDEYTELMKNEVRFAISQQESLGLDVLVHGEPERNDMVEYFGEQLEGYAFSQFGWVQSYGSRCVKPPILFGDISRPKAMTVRWAEYAQTLTNKPVKGMLTGPVTLFKLVFCA